MTPGPLPTEDLAQVLNATAIGTWSYDIPHDVVVADAGLASMFGLPAEHAAAGAPLARFTAAIHPADRDGVIQSISRAIVEADRYEAEYRVQPAPGVVRWVIARGRVVRDAEGKAVRLPGVVVDVTEARRALAEREMYSRLLESSEAFAALCDLDGRLSFINPGWLVHAGWRDTQEALAAPLARHLAPQDAEALLPGLLQRAREHGQARAELRLRAAEGRACPWVMLHVQLHRDDDGRPAGYGLIGLDITERKRSELALASEKAILEKIAARASLPEVLDMLARSVEAQSDAGMLCSVLLADVDERHLLHGAAPSLPAAYNEAIHGIEIGPDVGSCGSAAHSRQPVFVPDIAKDARWAPFLPLAQAHGLASCCSTPVLSIDGHLLGTVAMYYRRPHMPSEHDVELIRNAGRLAAIAIERVRAEQRLALSEARFSLLADSLPHLVWACSPDGAMEFANERWRAYTGSDRGAAHDWIAAVSPDDEPMLRAQWAQALTKAEPAQFEARLCGAEGGCRWFKIRVLPMKSETGAVQRWIGTCTDIEADRQLAQERDALLEAERNARAEVEHAIRMRDDFVATLSHELRTPLTSILGWTAVLRKHVPDAATLERAIEVIDRNARLQTQMVDDLLDMSRILSGKLRLDVQRLDLAGVIEAAIETVRPAAEARGVKLYPVYGSAGVVRGDAARLQQVVWNLLSNAIKFTPRGGRVQIAHRKVGSQVEISVSDTGQGIPKDFLPHVFDRFRQADSSITRHKGGLGLGLSIVRNIVEMHGGSVSAFSEGEGCGSVFTVRLPMAVLHGVDLRDEPDGADPHSSSAPLPEGERMLSGLQLLVLDDDADSCELVARVLTDEGARVRTVRSVAEAMVAVHEMPQLDAILSDISLPGEDGYSFIRRVRNLGTPRARVTAVALTALARSEDRRRALLAGFHSHVAKPVEPAELIAVIATLCERTGVEAATAAREGSARALLGA